MNNFQSQHTKRITKFFLFWSQYYDNSGHPDEDYYFPYINDLTKSNSLSKLWQWKMGVYFKNQNCQRALKKMEEQKEIITRYRNSNPTFDELFDFTRTIFANGIVYSTFLIHICKPNEYPIFDQHVWRSYVFLVNTKIVKAPKDKDDYLNYKKFVFEIHKNHKIDLREIDKALMTFGQFLINPRKFLLKDRHEIWTCQKNTMNKLEKYKK